MAEYTIDKLNKTIYKLKNVIGKAFEKSKFNKALSAISVCANLLYISNQYYYDDDLENYIIKISQKLFSQKAEIQAADSIIFYDGFGFNNRGLAQIYLKALSKIGKVIYVTNEIHKNEIPDIEKIVLQTGKIVYLNKGSYIKNIYSLNNLVEEIRPKHFFMYTKPNDVVAPVVLYRYKDILSRFQINLTDHAFWLGVNSFDCCLEFRNYGAMVTLNERKVDSNKIKILPFYPSINDETEFKGYPFKFNEKKQKLIFSGGALYKTFGGDNKYYKIVNYLLENYPDVVFWYAGSGNISEISKIVKKFPDRAFLTEERADLFQVLKRCYFYLDTYPVHGGLMIQYAAMAGKIPLTLKSDDYIDDLLINQSELNCEIDSYEEICNRIDYLMNNPGFVEDISGKMRSAVITPEVFETQLKNIIEFGRSDYKMTDREYDTISFRKAYLDRLKYSDICCCIAQKDFLKHGLKVFPIKTFIGCMVKIFNKIFILITAKCREKLCK